MAVLKFDDNDIDGTLIKAADKKVYVAARGLPSFLLRRIG